jgi:hypothetical protein
MFITNVSQVDIYQAMLPIPASMQMRCIIAVPDDA